MPEEKDYTYELFVSPRLAQKLPSMVRNELAKLTAPKQNEFMEEYQHRVKSTPAMYLFWLLLGWHYAYMRQWGWQWLYWCTLGGFGMWALLDLFRIPGVVSDYNKDIAIEVMRNFKSILK